jgi:hypothetical protein
LSAGDIITIWAESSYGASRTTGTNPLFNVFDVALVGGGLGPQGVQGPAFAEDGWTAANETWTYASSTTFTVVGDVTLKYRKGDKLKLVQTTTKYFYIISTSFGGGTTTVTVTGGSDYTLANAAITGPYFSHVSNPIGFPHWFNYTAVWTGYSAGPTAPINRFKIEGNTCYVVFDATNGTSNAAGKTMSLPLTSANVSGLQWIGYCSTVNSGSGGSTPGKVRIEPNAAVANIYLNWDNVNMAASGNTFVYDGNIQYEF